MKKYTFVFLVLFSVLSFSAISRADITLNDDERLITVLQTNDIHGGVETQYSKNKPQGGLALFGGIAKSIRDGLKNKYGDKARVFVVDGGDQFQGTLISNYTDPDPTKDTDFGEGQIIFKAMNEVGYDAAITGNHDYDFGPIGPDDQVSESTPKDRRDPRGALKRLVSIANFPILSANTYYKNSIVDQNGKPVSVNGDLCQPPKDFTGTIDWSKAVHVDYLNNLQSNTDRVDAAAVIKNFSDVRVALVGVDNAKTSTTTLGANVSDICFRDEADAYLEEREKLKDKADVFVMIVHNGDTDPELEGDITRITKKILEHPRADGKSSLDAVAAGHTHYSNNLLINGVPVIQSKSGGLYFGRIDLVWSNKDKQVVKSKTRYFGGMMMYPNLCPYDPKTEKAKDPSQKKIIDFCKADKKTRSVSYEGVKVVSNGKIEQLIADARKVIDPIAKRPFAFAEGAIRRDYSNESPLVDQITDLMRELSGADVVLLNGSGVRANLNPDDLSKVQLNYEDLYKILPISNHGVLVKDVPADALVKAMMYSAKTCGAHGVVIPSGLKVEYERDCRRATNQSDEQAKLKSVKLVNGDKEEDLLTAPADKTYTVATFDFLHDGGSGFTMLKPYPASGAPEDLGIVRERIFNFLVQEKKGQFSFTSKMDNRFKNLILDNQQPGGAKKVR